MDKDVKLNITLAKMLGEDNFTCFIWNSGIPCPTTKLYRDCNGCPYAKCPPNYPLRGLRIQNE